MAKGERIVAGHFEVGILEITDGRIIAMCGGENMVSAISMEIAMLRIIRGHPLGQVDF